MKRKIRSMIMAPKGSTLLSFDLSQAESWIVAFLANERRMKQSLFFGDIHSDTSCGIFYSAHKECLHKWIKNKETSARQCSICNVVITDTERYLGKKNNHANCLDAKTEVLTQDGWKLFSDLLITDLVAVWNSKTKLISFEFPLVIHEYDWNDNLYCFEDIAFCQNVTPEHKMYDARINKTRTAKNIATTARVPLTGKYNYEDKKFELDYVIALMVATQADATYLYGKTVFHFKKERKIDRIEMILNKLEIKYSKSLTADGSTYIRYYNYKSVDDLLDNKKFNITKLLTLNWNQRITFLNELSYWDGTTKNTATIYFSSLYQNVSAVQTIAHITGYQALLRLTVNGYHVSINARKLARLPYKKQEHYKGKVYCLTTSTGFFLVKRNDKISVSGNSYGQSEGMLVTSINKESDKPPYITVGISEVRPMFKAWHNYINLSGWWESIQSELGPRRQLTTPYDFTRTFYGYWGKELFKEAYAFKPQSTIADHVFGAIHKDLGISGGLLEIYRRCVVPGYCKIINTAHDSFVMEYPSETIPDDFIANVAKLFRRPIIVRGEEFTIPCDAKRGPRYDEGMEEIDINKLIGPANANRTLQNI